MKTALQEAPAQEPEEQQERKRPRTVDMSYRELLNEQIGILRSWQFGEVDSVSPTDAATLARAIGDLAKQREECPW